MAKLKLTKIVLLMFATFQILATASCVSAPERALSDQDIKYADTKALIVDKVKSESNTASIDLFYHKDGYIRLEVTALLGYKLGSLLITQQQVSYALHPQKVFVQGPLVAKTLRPLFKQDLDPKLIWAIVFDQDLKKYGFDCKIEGAQQVCAGLAGGATAGVQVNLQILSEKKPDQLKKITIENANLKFVWLFKSIRKHNKSYNETFVLNKPDEYRLITIK